MIPRIEWSISLKLFIVYHISSKRSSRIIFSFSDFFLVPNRGFALLKSLEHFSSLMFYYNLWSFLRCWKVLLKETKVMAEELNYRINGLIVQSAHHTSMNDFEFLPHISQHWRCYWTTLRSNSITVHLNRLWSCHENFGLQMAQ